MAKSTKVKPSDEAKPEKEAPGEVRHSGQAFVRLVLFAIVVLMLVGLVWALVRMSGQPATPAVTSEAVEATVL